MNNIKQLKLLFIASFTILLFGSCQKDIVDDFEPIQEKWESVDAFYKSVDMSKRIQIPNAESEFVFQRGNFTLHFDENSIVDKNGQIVTGNIILKYINPKSSGELLLNQLSSTTSGATPEIIHIEDVFDIQLFKGSEEVFLKASKPVTLYYSKEDNTFSLSYFFERETSFGQENWFPSLDFIQSTEWDFNVNGQNYKGKGYSVKMRHTGWFSIASFESELFNEDDYNGKLTLTIDESLISDDVKVYVSFQNKMVVIPVIKNGATFTLERLLKNEEITISALSTKDYSLLYHSKHFISDMENDVVLIPTEISSLELINELKQL